MSRQRVALFVLFLSLSILSATAAMASSSTAFLDGYGRVTQTFAVGERAHVRVEDSQHNYPGIRDTVYVTVAAPGLGDQEQVELQETGFDTGIFEGSVATSNATGPSGDGVVGASFGQAIEAVYQDSDPPNSSRADATMTANRLELMDGKGRPAEVYLESTRAYVRVVDTLAGSPVNADAIQVVLQADLSGDQELLTLTETGPATGLFEGSIQLRQGPGQPGDGLLQTYVAGPPYEFDTVRATFFGSVGTSTDAVGTAGSLTSFVDAYGNEVTAYAAGVAARVRVEDHNANDPSRFDFVPVTVSSLQTGDAEGLALLEVAKDSGIFEGALPTRTNAPASLSDGLLQVQVGEEIEAMHVDFNGVLASGARARIEYASVSFVDEAGRPTVELLENDRARVRLLSLGGNGNPGSVETLTVDLRSLYAGDLEPVILTETGPDTSIFEGSIQLVFNVSASQGSGVLETGNQGPDFPGEQVTASYGPFSATARTVGARVVFIDDFGRQTSTFPLGSKVRVRVSDPSHNNPTNRDNSAITLSACQNDQELVQLAETGFDTGVFEGEIPSGNYGSYSDGLLKGSPSCVISAFYQNPNNPRYTQADAVFTGGEVLFVDAQGQPASVFLEGTRAYLRVVDHSRSGTAQVFLSTDLSNDQEPLTLQETAGGVFTGSIELRSSPSGQFGNGILETSEASGPPHEFETLRASYQDATFTESTATAATQNFRVWFLDAFGNVVSSYAQGSRVYVRVEDHNFNDPTRFDGAVVTVRTSQGDEEPLALLETGKNTGVYEGSLDLDGSPPVSLGDGHLQAGPGDDLEARIDSRFNASPARARVEYAAISFVDDAGRPAVELLENGTARVRVLGTGNGSPGTVDTLTVDLRSLYAGDVEQLLLTETGPDTNAFEGSIRLAFNFSASPGNGVVETGNQGPEFLGEAVTASYGPYSATARTVGARVVFIDDFGRQTSKFPLGSKVRVRVTDPSHNNPTNRDNSSVTLSACQNDQELVQLAETGFDTGVFEGEIPSGTTGSYSDGILKGSPSCVISAFYQNPNNPRYSQADAVFTGGEVLFVDAQGQPASVFLEGTRAYLRVVDHSRSGTALVFLSTDLSNDQEPLTLQETAGGVFTGSIELRSSPSGQFGNGILETSEASGPPHEFETLRASYQDATFTESTAVAATQNFRVWFLDAFGNVVSSYAQGSRVYVRVEDHNFNDPARFDGAVVTVRTSQGDEELLALLETGKNTGVYEGSLDLDGSHPVSLGDGHLQAGPGDDLEARIDSRFNASPARARVEYAAISFVDEAGRPTVELLENGLARVRVLGTGNGNPGDVDTLTVEVRSLYAGDLEQVLLTETGPATNAFEGSIRLAFNFSASPGNGVMETGNQGPEFLGEAVTASYGPYSVTAHTAGARVVFVDEFGRQTSKFPLGFNVRVRVTDPSHNNPTNRDVSSVTLLACQNDQELVQLMETGFNTGVFEGEIPSGETGTYGDGVLKGSPSCVISAFYQNPNDPELARAEAVFTGGAVLFVDAQGQPASIFLEGTRAYLRVVDHSRSGTAQVFLSTDLSNDQEPLTLQETAGGVFTGSIELRSSPSGQFGNGILETSEASGPPHEFETLRASYQDGTFTESTAVATTQNFRVWFLDAFGNVVSSYAQGSRVYVRVEDHNFNDPARFDGAVVTVRTSRGDEESLALLETGKNTGAYEGSIDLAGSQPVSLGDGHLQAGPGDDLEARIVSRFNASPAQARVEYAAISFIDEAGRPTVELLENGTARVRVLGTGNGSPGTVDNLTVEVRSFYAGDLEQLLLTETGPDTNAFEGSIRLAFNFSASQGNGVVETGNQGPEFLGEAVTASYGPYSATARAAGARVVFIDDFGRQTSKFPLGSKVRVRVTDPSHNNPTNRDNSSITLVACQNDQELVQLAETGFDTGVFEGEIPSGTTGSYSDGLLKGSPSCVISAFYQNPNNPELTRADAVFTGGEVLFVDAQGQPASIFLEGTRAYLRVVDHSRSGTVQVFLSTDLSNDQEPLTLPETAGGVFTGSIELRSSPSGQFGNGILETSEAAGPPHEFETLRASYQDATFTESTATAATQNFRVWFLDAYGNIVSSYAQGSRVYVRVEDHNFNDPARFDGAAVTVRTSQGDDEPLALLETGKNTGIYEGSIDLAGSQPVSLGDGHLQAGPGDDLEARIMSRFNASPAQARVEYAAVSFIDDAGRPTVELLENGTARVRVLGTGNGSPGTVDTLTVEVRSLYAGDLEQVLLTETGPDTNAFEGSIRLAFNFSASQGNGVVETSNRGPEFLGEVVTASYGPYSAMARAAGARVVFIDDFGRQTSKFPIGSKVRVRVTDPSHNNPTNRDNSSITLVACQNDQELVQLAETGFDTGIFEGEIPSGATGSYSDGILKGSPSCVISAFYQNPNNPELTRADAVFTGGEVLFVDAQGQPASVFLEGTRAYLRVVDHSRSGTVQVFLSTDLSHDQEPLTLPETDGGVFTGSIELRSSPSGQFGNGILETAEFGGPPFEFETLRASYQDATFTESTATASTLGYRVWFLDSYGAVVSSYAQGSRVYVRLEDHNFNDPAHIDRLYVDLRSSSGDQESVQVDETGENTGVYEGSMPLDGGAVTLSDGRLQALSGDEITADRNGPFLPMPVRARIEFASISFVDETGRPTVELLENGVARVRVFSQGTNGSPGVADTLTVELRSLYAGDLEQTLLTETGPDTSLFEGSIQLAFNFSANQGNGLLETSNQGPAFLGEQVTASYGPYGATARTAGSRITFLNLRGQEVTSYSLGATVRVRIVDHNRDQSPAVDLFTVQVRSLANGDNETVTMTETAPASGVFEGSVPSSEAAGSPGDGVLSVAAGQVVEAENQNANQPNPTTARASFLANHVPQAVDDQAFTVENEAVGVSVLVNDIDDSGPLTIVSVTQGAKGTVAVGPPYGTVTYTPNAGETGEDTFTYLVTDDQGGEAVATVTVTITPLNRPPVANGDTASVAEDGTVNVAVLANDTDPDNDTLIVESVTQGGHGSVSINPDQTVKYTPVANYNGSDSFTYTISDGNGETATATVTVTISPVNDAPVANADAASMNEDGSVNIAVLANDTDAEGDALTVTGTNHQAAVVNANGTVTFTPGANNFGTYTFNYTVSDGHGGTATGTVTVTVNEVNDPPVAVADVVATTEDATATWNVLQNDSDAENEALTVTSVTQPAHGTATIRTNGNVDYQGNLNYNGPDSFTYTVTDARGASATATVSVTVTPINDVPVANADTASVAEDGTVDIAVLANDTDVDGDTLTVSSTVPGTHGSVSTQPDKTIRYTPEPNFHGTDSFTYAVSDGKGGTSLRATVTVTVTPANDAPVANADTSTVAEDGTVNVAVLANDTDLDGDTLTVASVTQGAHGVVAINPDKTVKYTPAANYNGPDSFTYTVSDGNGGSATASVTVTVTSANDAPVANADTSSVAEDGTINVAVLANDTDPDSDTLSVASVTQGAHGVVSINPDKTVRYVPTANYNGPDTFTYTVSDGNGGSATATVTMTVTAVNDAPVANADTSTVAEDGTVNVAVLANDTDPDNDTLSVASVTQGAHGVVSINPDKTVRYVPAANYNGSDTFTYTASDGNGGSATATVTMTVTAVNDAPVANADTSTVAEDGTVNVAVLANDTDPDNDTLSVASVTQGAHGVVSINPDKTVRYVPTANYNGPDTFTYTVSDGNGGSATATVTMTVTAVNDAPVANADASSVAEDGTVNVAVLANDTDPDNDTLSVASVTQGAHGVVSINPDKTVRYVPAANYNGPDTFTYTASDGNGGSATAAVTMTVTAVNDAPVANADTSTVAEDGTVNVAVLANDTDLEANTLTVASVTQGAHGVVSINPDKTVRYAPAANYNGPDTFTYTASDGNGGSATASVSIVVSAVNDAPVAVNDTATVVAGSSVTISVLANDVDVDGPSLSVTAVTQGTNDTVTINPNQTVTYTAGLFVGTDSFTYTVSDGAGGTATATVTVTVTAPPRVTTNLQVRYDFNEGSGSTVNDTSGVGAPYNLSISAPGAVSWLPGALSVNSAVVISSLSAATKVINAARASNAVTVEAWVVADNLTQTGPARIVSINKNSSQANIVFGQSGNRYETQTSTSAGTRTQQTPVNSASLSLKHVVYTRNSSGLTVTYIDGVPVISQTATGAFSNWDTTFRLALANAIGGGKPWVGDLYLVALYGSDLTANQVRQNFLAGAGAN